MSKNFETQENLRTFFSKKSVYVPISENWLACIKNKKITTNLTNPSSRNGVLFVLA